MKKKKTEGEASAAAITPTVVNKSESAYQQIVENMCKIVTGFQSEAVLFYHKLGKHVNEVTSRPDKYGSKNVENLSKSLEGHNVFLKSASLYDAQNIFKTLTTEQLKKVMAARFSLRRTLLLCRKNVTDEMREEIIDEAFKHKDEPKPYDVQAAIEAKLGTSIGDGTTGEGKPDGGSADNDGGSQDDDAVDAGKAARRIKNAVKLIETTTKKLEGLDDCVALICSGSSADRIKAVFTDFDVLVTAMDELGTRWGNQVTTSNAAFEKVKEILKS